MTNKIYLATNNGSAATDMEGLDSKKPGALTEAGNAADIQINGKSNAQTLLAIDTTNPDNYGEFKSAFEKKFGSSIAQRSSVFYHADIVNAYNLMMKPTENAFLIPVKSEDINWFCEAFDLKVEDQQKYPGQDYYKIELNFSDVTPNEAEIAQLSAYVAHIEAEGLTNEAAIGAKYGPDLLTLYAFAKEHAVTDDFTVDKKKVNHVFGSEPGDLNNLPRRYFCKLLDHYIPNAEELFGKENYTFILEGLGNNDNIISKAELEDFKTSITMPDAEFTSPSTWSRVSNTWKNTYEPEIETQIYDGIMNLMTNIAANSSNEEFTVTLNNGQQYQVKQFIHANDPENLTFSDLEITDSTGKKFIYFVNRSNIGLTPFAPYPGSTPLDPETFQTILKALKK